jgi:hypothetical protein
LIKRPAKITAANSGNGVFARAECMITGCCMSGLAPTILSQSAELTSPSHYSSHIALSLSAET